MEDVLVPIIAIPVVMLGLPWLILHYVTKWKQAKSITLEDENLLDELHDIARRLDDRMTSIERIIAVDRGEPVRVSDLRREANNVELHPQFRRDRSI
ncbi:MAG: envelope stress response membrane protein PspB [Sphingomonas sp.]|nr:MAG: envelope stress response membrane protein PspB [Sphingomonas sp.]